jgi:TRAP transporter TAXI family solute receptor
MLKLSRMIGTSAVLIVSTALAGGAWAQTVGIGTTKGGATAQVTAGISKIVSQYGGGLQMRPQPMGGTQQYIPIVNSGELEFGVANMMQTYMAFTGTGLSQGAKADNLRLVATMMVFQTGLLVRKDSGINTTADLKGKRMPSGFDSSPLFQHMMSGFLANGDVSWDSVQKVPVVALAAGFNAFKEGKIDAMISAVGSAPVTELNASLPSGVRFLQVLDTPEAEKRSLVSAPRTFVVEVMPRPKLVGVDKPTKIFAFDYMLWANKGVSDDVVYKVTKAMYEHEKDLKTLSPLWTSFFSKNMAKDQGLPYHPGAIKLYKEVGLWAAGRGDS